MPRVVGLLLLVVVNVEAALPPRLAFVSTSRSSIRSDVCIGFAPQRSRESIHSNQDTDRAAAELAEDVAFGERHLLSALEDARRRAVPMPSAEVFDDDVLLSFVVVSSLLLSLLLADVAGSFFLGGNSMLETIGHEISRSDLSSALDAAAPASLLILFAEWWRRAAPGATDSDADERLGNAVILCCLPATVISSSVFGDTSVGERAAHRVVHGDSLPVEKAALRSAAAMAAAAWTHGLLQATLSTTLSVAASHAAVSTLPIDPAGTWGVTYDGAEPMLSVPWWYIGVAAAPALAPLLAAACTALVSAAADSEVARTPLRPVRRAKEAAAAETRELEVERAPKLFALSAPPARAERRADALHATAAARAAAAGERARRTSTATAVRAGATAYACMASGGSILAPVIATLSAELADEALATTSWGDLSAKTRGLKSPLVAVRRKARVAARQARGHVRLIRELAALGDGTAQP